MVPIRKIVLLAIALAALSCIPLYLHLTQSTAEYSRYNTQWNGTSVFVGELVERDAVLVPDLRRIPSAQSSRLLLIAPDGTYTAGDLGAIRSYLDSGNTVFLADDTGAGNQVLEGIGAQTRIQPGNLSSLDFFLWDAQSGRYQPSSVIASVTHDDLLTRDVEVILLNKPAAVEGGEVLAETSLMSWMDENGDRRISPGETLGAYSVFARERVGAGTLYVLGDPSIFTNGMVELSAGPENNTVFLTHVADSPVILVDQSHSLTGEAGVLVPVLAAARSMKVTEILMVGMISILVAYLFYRRIL
ncbi:MAG: DUF4350 domain-containing protein [Methanomicrobiales archaeon]|nr:DUF4350 domain-containing protein [Methanomicrobiales archaeon]